GSPFSRQNRSGMGEGIAICKSADPDCSMKPASRALAYLAHLAASAARIRRADHAVWFDAPSGIL
ncbi:MAG TPA: hypothetical protein VE222_10315, partial [Nitrospiraceae bacterium]|nr:hypothetical protein [Nitrospiraceae bacterium]